MSYRSKTTKLDNGELNGAIVQCGNGSKLIGGGVISDSAYRHGLYLSDTLKDGGAWESRVVQLPDGRRQEARDHHDGDLPGLT